MHFDVAVEAMNGIDSTLNDLDAILSRVEDGIHELDIPDADTLGESRWYVSCRQTRRKLLEEIARTSVYRGARHSGPHLRRIPVTDEASARTARGMAFSSLRVLVENADSDGNLVRFALRVYAKKVTYELCFGPGTTCRPAAVEIESRGGTGELKKLVEARLTEAKNAGLAPRIVVVHDSDAEWLGDVKDDPRAVVEVCAAGGVPCQQLTKRTAENYVPERTWTDWAAQREATSHRSKVTALLQLSSSQLDFLRFADSTTPPWNTGNPQVMKLYAGVAEADYQELRKASLKKLAASALAFALGQSLPSPADVRSRDRNGDLERIVRCIEDEL